MVVEALAAGRLGGVAQPVLQLLVVGRALLVGINLQGLTSFQVSESNCALIIEFQLVMRHEMQQQHIAAGGAQKFLDGGGDDGVGWPGYCAVSRQCAELWRMGLCGRQPQTVQPCVAILKSAHWPEVFKPANTAFAV